MGMKWKCSQCGLLNDMSLMRCVCGAEATEDEVQIIEIGDKEIVPRTNWLSVLVVLGIIIFVAAGFLRIYYGGGLGFKIVTKHSFSFKDTIVNLDDLLGKPRILVAAEHPAVKRQLEDMGVFETDEQVQKRLEQEIELKSKQMMRDYEKEMKRLQRQLGY